MSTERFHGKALDSGKPVEEEVLVNVCLHGRMEEYGILGETIFLILLQVDGSRLSHQRVSA